MQLNEDTDSNGYFAAGTLAKFHCESEHELIGSELSVCKKKGKWSGSRKCKRMKYNNK